MHLEAGMPTTRFARLIGVPERRTGAGSSVSARGRPARRPWPAPSQERLEGPAVAYADRHPAWGHRKLAASLRTDGQAALGSTVLRALRRTGRVLPVDYQAQRRQHAAARRAALVVPPSWPNQVWQLDFSEFETRHGGTWRIGGVSDCVRERAFGETTNSTEPETLPTS